MNISFNCTKCGKTCQTKSENAGKRAKCRGCGTVLTVPSPQASAKPATPEQPSMTTLLDEMDEELAAAQSAEQRIRDAGCPTCGRPYPPGQSRCSACSMAARASARPAGPRKSKKRHGSKSGADRSRRTNEAGSNLPAKVGAVGVVVLIVGGLLFFGSKFISGVSTMQIDGVVGSPEISNAHALSSNADWLDLNLGDVPIYVSSCEDSAVEKSTASFEGIWIYHIKAAGRSWGYALSAEASLSTKWLNQLGGMGYFKEYNERPDPIKITGFIIKEPMGRTWVMDNEAGDAMRMCNLAVMLGSQSCKADLAPLMKVKRGTLAYAVFFSAINQKSAADKRIALSCDADSDVRTFAAEMLLSTLPLLRTDATPSDIDDKQQYESMLTELAQATSTAEKEKIYQQLREQLLVQLRVPHEASRVQLGEEGGLDWTSGG